METWDSVLALYPAVPQVSFLRSQVQCLAGNPAIARAGPDTSQATGSKGIGHKILATSLLG